jgi:hypothetical protein
MFMGQKQSAPLGLIGTDFQEASIRDLAMRLADRMRPTQIRNQLFIAGAQLAPV